MSINDPIYIRYREKHKDYIVRQGRETFYDEEDCLYTFDTYEDAAEWIYQNFPPSVVNLSDPTPKYVKDGQIRMDL